MDRIVARTLSPFSCLGVLVLAGCAATDQKTAFESVQNDVSRQTGLRVTWNQETPDDQKAEAALHQLLARPLNANDAVQVALLNNPDLQASFEEIGISQADLVQAGLLHNPTFMASWRFPDRPPSIADTEYSLAYDFLDLVMVPLKIKIAQANLEQTELRLDHEVLELATQVKTAFYEVQAQKQLEARLKLIVEANQAGVDLSQAQRQAGNITDLEEANEQAQLTSARLYLANAEREMVSAREKLNRLMGLWGDEIDWKIDPDLPPVPDRDLPLPHLEAQAISQRRDLAALRRETDSIGLALSLRTKTRFVPTRIDIGVDTEQTPDKQHVTGPTLSLDLPIFDQGQGDIAKLAAQYRLAQEHVQSRAVEIRSQVREARDILKVNRDLVDYYKKVVVPLNVRIVDQSMAQFNAMQKSAFDVFLSKQQELETEKGYVEACRDYWIARAQLEQAVGGRLEDRT